MPHRFLVAVPMLLAAAPGFAADARVFFLKDDGRRFSIEAIAVPAGRTEVVTCGRGQPYVDVVYPPAVGGSASLAQAEPPHRVAVVNATGTPRVLVKTADRQYDLPALEDPAAADCRVSVIAADGRRQAFVIRGFETVVDDTIGPVLDLFAGKVPMQPGDVVVCTETWRRVPGPATRGEAAITHDRYLFADLRTPAGAATHAVVDLGAGQTFVARAMVPAGVTIAPARMMRITAGSIELEDWRTGGATGDVSGVAGEAVLPELRVGGIAFRDAPVIVLDSLPRLAGREVGAILGLDLMRRAPRLVLEYPQGPGRGGRLRLLEAGAAPADGTPLPSSVVNSHVIVRARIGETAASLILDSGAPTCILDADCAEAAGLEVSATGRRARGLDGGEISVGAGTVASLALGDRRLDRLGVDVAPLPVFAKLRTHGQSVGLLGNDAMARLGRIEIDFERGTVWVPAGR